MGPRVVLALAAAIVLAGCAQPAAGPGPEPILPKPGGFELLEAAGWSWHEATPLPRAASGAACALHDDELWFVGGLIEGQGATAIVQVYDAAADTWRREVPLPRPSYQAMALVVDGDLWVAGGFADGFRSQVFDEVYIRGAFGFWNDQSAPTLPTPLAQATVLHTEDGDILAGGTKNGLTAMTSTIVPRGGFLTSWTEGPTLASARAGAAMAAINDTAILAVGGWSDAKAGARSDAEAQQDNRPPTSWPAMPTPRSGFASAPWDGRLWIFGGLGADGNATDATEFIDLKQGFWWRGPVLPTQLHDSCAVPMEDGLHVLGGRTSDGAPSAGHWVLRGPVDSA